jgi:hypothetical protein
VMNVFQSVILSSRTVRLSRGDVHDLGTITLA